MQRTPMMAFRPALRSAGVRRQFATKPVRRSYQTAANAQPAAGTSHVVSGLAGGSVVLLGIYGYYHFSGAKTAVNSVRQMTQTAQDLKEKAVASTPSPKAMLGFIRSAALSYGSAFPGASYIVNQTFDQIDQIAEKNGPEVEKIVKEVYADIQKAVQSGGDNVTDKVLAVIQEASNKVQQLSSQLSVSALQPYLEKNPQLKSAINDSLSQLNEFSGKYGPEAKKIAEDTINEIKNIADKGLTGESIMKASALAKEKLKQIQDLGAKAGSEAYAKAAEGARPYLDKAPDVKKYLEDSIGGLKEYVGDDGVKLINDTYADLEKAGKKGDTKALANIVKERIEQLQKLAEEKGPELANKASAAVPGLSSIPGMDKLLEAVPNLKDIQQLRELAQEKGGDFEKLLNNTYDEIKEILEKRAKEAKELGGEAASDAKSKISK